MGLEPGPVVGLVEELEEEPEGVEAPRLQLLGEGAPAALPEPREQGVLPRPQQLREGHAGRGAVEPVVEVGGRLGPHGLGGLSLLPLLLRQQPPHKLPEALDFHCCH